jgi:hypothetical protein
MADPEKPYTVGWYFTCNCTHNKGFGGVPQFYGNTVFQGAFGVKVRNHDGLVVISDTFTGFWAFKLEGFDGEWVNAGRNRVAQYTNLPPGRYTFRVTAANADGVSNDAGASLVIDQAPRFYQTTLFLLACVAGTVSLAWAAYRIRIARLQERERALKENIAEALANVKVLSGLLPVCASCKKIRDDKGYWNQIETYISDHSEADFSHGICPECLRRLYPEYADRALLKRSREPQ